MSKSELLTSNFWQRTFSQAIHSAAAGALTPLATQELRMLNSVPWYAVASAAALGALLSLLLSLASVKVPGTVPASFVPSRYVDTNPDS
jgi:hypothetical protein